MYNIKQIRHDIQTQDALAIIVYYNYVFDRQMISLMV